MGGAGQCFCIYIFVWTKPKCLQLLFVYERVLCPCGDHSLCLAAGEAVAWHGTLNGKGEYINCIEWTYLKSLCRQLSLFLRLKSYRFQQISAFAIKLLHRSFSKLLLSLIHI